MCICATVSRAACGRWPQRRTDRGFMMRRRQLLAVVPALAAAYLAPSRTTRAQTGVTPSAEGITVYNAQHASLAQAWAQAFTRETGIRVTPRNGSDTEMGNQIVQEGAASPADVFLTENPPAMALVLNAGVFART